MRHSIEYLLSNALTQTEDQTAQSEGWCLTECEGDIQLQKIDEMETFAKDEDAHEFVKQRADNGSPLHVKVREFLREHSFHEYETVFC